MNRFQYDTDADRLECSACGGRAFRYRIGGPESFELRPMTSDGPIHEVLGATQPPLRADVVCAGCGMQYGPGSRWDPAR